MHVAFLTPEYSTPDAPDGGLANYVRKTTAAIAGRGHEVSVILASRKERHWRDGAVRVIEVPVPRSPQLLRVLDLTRPLVRPAEMWAGAQALAAATFRLHRERPIDLAQCASFRAVGSKLVNNAHFPVVSRISSYAPLLRTAYGERRDLSQSLSDWLEIQQLQRSNAVFAPSAFMARILQRFEGLRVDVIRSPVEAPPAVTDTGRYKSLGEGEYVLYFGTLSPIKGVDLLAGVLRTLLERWPGMRFVLAGRDDKLPSGQPIVDLLRRSAGPESDRVLATGRLSRSELYPIVAGARVVVMPSRVDNYPNTCLEAMSLGVPVVGTRDSSLEEMIEDGVTGFLVENGSSEAILQGIERALMMSDLERENMRARILSSIEKVMKEEPADSLLSFYARAIETWNAPRGSRHDT